MRVGEQRSIRRRYRYDAVDRLVRVDVADRRITYSYDPAGNRTTEVVRPANDDHDSAG
jgi:YD repeat-containing protein